MKTYDVKTRLKLLFIFSITFSFSCILFFETSKDYVLDNKLVYIRQPNYLIPIKYFPVKTIPYKWTYDVKIDPTNPGILSLTDFNKLLATDFKNDAIIFKETKEHLLLMKDDPVYKKMKEVLINFNIQRPLPRRIFKGNKINDYSNAEEYSYPDESGAFISFLKNDEIMITFSDGRKYYQKSNGSYYEEDAKGNEIYAVFPNENAFRLKTDDFIYFYFPDEIKIKNSYGELIKFIKPNPQYSYKPAAKKYYYIFFVDDFISERINSIALIHDNLLRYDYIIDKDAVMVNNKEKEAVIVTNDNIKTYHYFNASTRKAEDLFSFYYPEGIRIIDVNKPMTNSSINPIWPENYIEMKMGPFRILYTKKDEELLKKINIQKLSEADALARKLTGINYVNERVVILPPDLESFRKLHAGKEEEILKWYPSGFEGKDLIVMWPPSVKRYKGVEGDKYFWEKEFYEILIHQLTLLIVGELTGVFSDVPVWLNEGLALYVECQFSDEAKRYWEITYKACEHYKKFLSWDDASDKLAENYSLDVARAECAQSYKMIFYLINKYGINKVINYIKSFKVQITKTVSKKPSYKESFSKIFNTSWDENLINFSEYLKNKDWSVND